MSSVKSRRQDKIETNKAVSDVTSRVVKSDPAIRTNIAAKQEINQDYERLKKLYPKLAYLSYQDLVKFDRQHRENEAKQRSYQIKQDNRSSYQVKRDRDAAQREQKRADEAQNLNIGLRIFGQSDMSTQEARNNPDIVEQKVDDVKKDIAFTVASAVPIGKGVSLLKTASKPLYHALNLGIAGLSTQDMIENGPNLMNTIGIVAPAYKAAAEANMKEAEAMGLKYVPTYEYPSYQNLKNKGVQTVFVNEPTNNSQGWVRTSADSPVTINLAKAKDIRTVNAHEDAHVARHAWLDPNYPALDVKKQQAFLRHKNSQVFQDDLADLSKEAGSQFYDFSSTGFPHEAVTNTRDLGKFYGIKVGQEYPGPEKTLQLLNRMEREAKPGFQKRFIQAFRRDPEHLPYVWKALNGTQWALLFGVVGAAGASQLDSYKEGGSIERFGK